MKAYFSTFVALMLAFVTRAAVMIETEPVLEEAGHFNRFGILYIAAAVVVALAIAGRLAYPLLRSKKESEDFHLFI